MRAGILRFAILASCIFLTSVVRADDATPLAVTGEADFMSGELGGSSLTRGGLGAAMRFGFSERFGVHAGLRAGFLRLRFDHSPTDGLRAKGVLWTPLEPSARLGASFAPLLAPRCRLDLIGEIESSLPGAEPDLTRLEIGTADGMFDVSGFGDQQAHPSVFWKRLSLGAEIHAEFGRFEPMLGIAFEAVNAAIDLRLSETADEALRSLGYDGHRIERRYAEDRSVWLVPLRFGLGYRFAPDDRIAVGGLLAFGGGPLLGANLAYSHFW